MAAVQLLAFSPRSITFSDSCRRFVSSAGADRFAPVASNDVSLECRRPARLATPFLRQNSAQPFLALPSGVHQRSRGGALAARAEAATLKEQIRCQAVGMLTPETWDESVGCGLLEDSEDEINEAPPKGLWGWILSKTSARFRGLILLNVLTFLYGSNVSIIKEGQASLDVFCFSFGRFAIAALAFVPFLRAAFSREGVRRAGLELGVWASAGYVAQAIGLQTTEAGRAAFIGTFTVIEVPLIAGLVFGAKIPRITWASAAAAVLGVALLETAASDSSLAGELWTIVSALLFGIHMLRSEHHARHVTPQDAMPLISLQLLVTAVLSALWMALLHFAGLPIPGLDAVVNADWAAVSHWPWWQMAYTGVLSTAFCLWVEVVALRDVSAAEAAMVYTLEPLWGASFAWVLLGERWGTAGWIGAALILCGSLTMQLYGQVEAEAKEDSEAENQMPLMAALGVTATMALIMAFSANMSEAEAKELPAAGRPVIEVEQVRQADAASNGVADYLRETVAMAA